MADKVKVKEPKAKLTWPASIYTLSGHDSNLGTSSTVRCIK